MERRRTNTVRLDKRKKEISDIVINESMPLDIHQTAVPKHHTAINIQDLHFPPGLKHHNKSLLELENNKLEEVGDIESRLMGLPGSLQLDNKKSNKYFGVKAREEFFSRYHWLNRQRKITIKTGEEDMDRLYFECAKSPLEQEIPFAPVRPKSAPAGRKAGHIAPDHLVEPSPKSFADRLARILEASKTNRQELAELSIETQEESIELPQIVDQCESVPTEVHKQPQPQPQPQTEVNAGKAITSGGLIADSVPKGNIIEGGQDEYTQTIQRIVSENNLTTLFKSKISGIESSAARQIIVTTDHTKKKQYFNEDDMVVDNEQAKAPQQFQKRATIKSDMKMIYDFMYSQKTARTLRANRQLQISQLNNPVATSTESKEEHADRDELSAFEKGRQYHTNAMQHLKKRKEEFVAARRTERPKSAPASRSHVSFGELQTQRESNRVHDIGYVIERTHTTSTSALSPNGGTGFATEKGSTLSKREEFFENASASMDDTSTYADGTVVTESTISTTAYLWKCSGYKTLGPLRPLESTSHDDQRMNSIYNDDDGDNYLHQHVGTSFQTKPENTISNSKGLSLKNYESHSNHSISNTEKKEPIIGSGNIYFENSFLSVDTADREFVDKHSALINTAPDNFTNSNIISRELRKTADPKQRRLNIMKFHHDKMKTTEFTDREEIELSRGDVESPRTKFLVGCIEQNLNPRAALVLRKNLTKRLDLQHHGIGDGMAALLAESLKSLPFIQAINIADNRLTDDGMGPILQAAVQIPGLLELNMSQNVIGPVSAACLFEYLISPTCPLERLILKSADVDDFECENFVKAIRENRSLIELDLSSNLIGKAENLNTVMPELTTGAEALADLLRMPECKIKTLRLDWNMIRLDGAIDLANSISSNQTLTFLDLSYNSLATGGGITLGVSLLANTTLETLILQNNNLDSVACFTICAGIIENRGLKKVALDGNPIGEQGMRAVMMVPLLAGNRVRVSATKCNIRIKDAHCWFDFGKLTRDYSLDMTDGFSRAVAIILLHLIAGHPTYLFRNFQYESAKGKKMIPIDLVQETSKELTEYFDAKQSAKLKYFIKATESASDMRACIAAFHRADYKGEGMLNRDTMGDLLDKMGIHLTDQRLDDLYAEFDTDDNGGIDLKEYLSFIKTLKLEAEARARDLTDIPIMALRGETGKRYIPPETGSLNFTIFDGFAQKPLFRIMTECDHHYVAQALEDTGSNAVDMMAATLEMVKIRVDEALVIVDSLLRDIPDKVKALRKVVLAIINFRDAYGLISTVLGDELSLHLRLKKELGPCYRVIMGNLNGYYILDLAQQIDRICLERLIELSATFGFERQQRSKIAFGRVGDLSQKGNWTCFRNEFYEGKSVALNGSFLTSLPGKGKLEFDFIGGSRPNKDCVVMTDINVVKALLSHHMLKKKNAGPALLQLQVMKVLTDQALTCAGNTFYEASIERSSKISEFSDAFYANLDSRRASLEETRDVKEKCDILSFKNELLDMFERDRSQVYPMNINQFVLLDGTEAGSTGTAILDAETGGSSAAAGASGFAGGRKSVLKKSTRSTTIGRKSTRLSTIGSKSRDSVLSSSTGFGAGANGLSASATALDEMTQLLRKGFTDIQGNEATETDSDREESSDSSKPSRSNEASGSAAATSNEKDKDADVELEETEAQRQWKQDEQMLDDAMKLTAKIKQRWESTKKQKKITYHTKRRRNICRDEGYLKQPAESNEFFIRLKEGLESQNQMTIGSKAQRLIDLFEDYFGRLWIYCRHLALLLQCFLPYGFVKQTKHFGTYRVELVISLFARLADLHNFELVLAAVSPFEAACLYCRLGWLNIFNPCKPEGTWELDLSRREERVVAKTLCTLAVNEIGDNWQFYCFRWTRAMEPMPGWELTQPWLTEEGMPIRGILTVTFYSGEGKQKKNCKPYVAFRKSLLNLVLVNEDEVVLDEVRTKPADVKLSGEKAFERHITIWESYLGPNLAALKGKAADVKTKDKKGKGKKGKSKK